ncbi:MAG: sigma-54-dependent Fis family transcriptional regulator [Candidatus Tectomicrobia bacterium]|uniref:Sigma-54-dependent Fis family transcriptional regulator n=1 Tax=Tectimicrobiota bacterium TaxID=2528274 RepID=A0A932FXM7_UNCTE|nr:sigma-54-dependent Fis family transcriptional regulator [Candidatus Tectomicrobia bacterium]
MEQIRILVVEDDPEMVALLQDYLTREGFQVEAAFRGEEAVERVGELPFDLVVTDVRLGGIDGIDVLQTIKALRSEIPVVLITAFGSIESAVEAVKQGAFHYLAKPFKLNELKRIIEQALEDRQLREETVRLRREVEGRYRFGALIGKSPKMQEIFELISLVARSSSNVLISGESGTGKELVAKAIHCNSSRQSRPFVPVNCAAIPSELLESELFGHMKGAFTGAHIARKGLIETAEGGTLFLDEIADVPLFLQAKLLRVLQEKEVWPVGGREGIKVDLRFIAATNQELWRRVEGGAFREDLYFRLAVIRIQLPPLRERLEDIPLLVDHSLKKYAEISGKEIRGVSEGALALLLRRPWRGNVREMENIIEAAVALARGPILSLDDLSPLLSGEALTDAGEACPSLEELEKAHISQVLQQSGGNLTKAAALLGISRKTLYRKKKQYGMDSVSS